MVLAPYTQGESGLETESLHFTVSEGRMSVSEVLLSLLRWNECICSVVKSAKEECCKACEGIMSVPVVL